jgi:hypothetical protein
MFQSYDIQAICLLFDKLSMNTFELNWEGKHAKFVPKLIERISLHSTPAAKPP